MKNGGSFQFAMLNYQRVSIIQIKKGVCGNDLLKRFLSHWFPQVPSIQKLSTVLGRQVEPFRQTSRQLLQPRVASVRAAQPPGTANKWAVNVSNAESGV
jgi:hypothetical protein